MSNTTLISFEKWYQGLPPHKPSGGPARGTIGAALVVLEHLRTIYDLDIVHHQAKGGAQIKGLSAAAVAKILNRFGETRPFLKEGGRTNRGGPGDIVAMLDTLQKHNLERLTEGARAAVLTKLQQYLVDRVKDFHNRQRLKVIFDPAKSTWQVIAEILNLAKENGKEGIVAQYLVGAKLALRFPELTVENLSYSTADDQLGRPGDFHLGNTAFHVTVAPMQAVFDKCQKNIADGYRVYFLVPDRAVIGARQNAESVMPGRIAVESIESFVGHNIEELSQFSTDRLKKGMKRLLDEYNRRVDEVETDKSLLIEIPKNLQS